MARRTKKRVETHTLFIFEITDWEPMYELSVNGLKDEVEPYNEILLLHVDAVCRYPKPQVGRAVRFDLYGERDFMHPAVWKHERDWRPQSVAHLELHPSGGSCYGRLPHESMGALITALAHRQLGYVSLMGTPLARGKSRCWSLGFSRVEDVGDD
jgi:hypothetical protein